MSNWNVVYFWWNILRVFRMRKWFRHKIREEHKIEGGKMRKKQKKVEPWMLLDVKHQQNH